MYFICFLQNFKPNLLVLYIIVLWIALVILNQVNQAFVIAEIGINHNGDINLAKELISASKESGANAVKFQKRTVDIVYTQDYLNEPRESPWGKTQREQKEGLEFNKKDYDEIDSFCKEIEIDWFASAWDIESQNFLKITS